MALSGWGIAGATGAGPSKLFDYLPFRGYREIGSWNAGVFSSDRGWVQEWIDAIGREFDILAVRFINSSARANLLDPTYSPDEIAETYLATATAAPTSSVIQDTMLDVLCYVAGIPTPVNTNLTVAQKQALVALGWDLIKFKGTRLAMLRLAAAMTGGSVIGWTTPPYEFAVLVGDGDPSPGHGAWVPSTAAAVATIRPWLFSAITNHARAKLFPAWAALGVGYSQFRAGYSAAGEPTLPSGARINLISNGNFSNWTAGVPDGWSASGAGTLTQSSSATDINWEFQTGGAGSGYAAVFDLTGAAAGVSKSLSTSTSLAVNNQSTYRVEIDYTYRQAAVPYLDRAWIRFIDLTNSLYYDPETEEWGSTAVNIPLPVSDSTTERTRYGFDVAMNAASSALDGTAAVQLVIEASSDGSASTQLAYTIYRASVSEKFSYANELAAGGERTLWLPLHDAAGDCAITRASGAEFVETAQASRAAYKARAGDANQTDFPYHPAISGRGYRSNSGWGNVVIDGRYLDAANWTTTGTTRALADAISPIAGETTETATTFTNTTVGSSIEQTGIVADPSNLTFICGVYAKRISADGAVAGAGTVSVTAGSTTLSGSGTSFTTAAHAGRTISFSSGGVTYSYVVETVGGGTSITLSTPATATVSGVAYTFSTDDVTLELEAAGTGTQTRQTFALTQADGWKLLPMKAVAFGAGLGANPLSMTIFAASASTTVKVALTAAYLYDVTGKEGVLYPPIALTNASGPDSVEATQCQGTVSGANLHPLWLRLMTDLSSAQLNLTIVPMFDGTSQPDGTIFDFGQTLTRNRLQLSVASGALRLRLIDDGTNNRDASLTLIDGGTPTASQMTWRRDTKIEIRARWSATTGISLSAGDGNAVYSGSVPWTVSNASLAGIGIGNNFTGGAGQFDGIIRDVEVLQIGPPA